VPNRTFIHPIDITLHDIDAAGVMFFAHYYRHAHDAYEAFMTEIGLPLPNLIREGILLPLAHSEADYLLPVQHGDRLQIEISLERLGTASFTVRYRFLDTLERQVARVNTTHVMLDGETKQPAVLTQAMREILRDYLAEPVKPR
jgi:1,4-dihydroxy-2-naphthoyl-CoA hydrolase